MFGSGRDHRHFEMDGKRVYFHYVIYQIIENRKFGELLKTQKNYKKKTIEQLEKTEAPLRKFEIEEDLFRVNSYFKINQENLNLINSIYTTLEQLENYKNEAIDFEQPRVINQVRQRVLQQALEGALGTLKSCLNNELHLPIISANIGMFGMMK